MPSEAARRAKTQANRRFQSKSGFFAERNRTYADSGKSPCLGIPFDSLVRTIGV
jgi:hypothetical protein